MSEAKLVSGREQAIHLLRSGYQVKEVASALGRSASWVRKWRGRHAQDGWAGLKSRSRAPCHNPRQMPPEVEQAVRRIRSELEAAQGAPDQLHYIGARTIQSRLVGEGLPPPSVPSIERSLRRAGMTHARKGKRDEVDYPHLHPTGPHQLCQVDIVPSFIAHKQSVACYNAIDVVSRYPTGQPYAQKRAEDSLHFLVHVWQTLGIPIYTQMDNEGCFSGGHTHPGVLGRVLRLGLYVGTEIVFSPLRHPESNGSVERFHQDYTEHVWKPCTYTALDQIGPQSERFMTAFRLRRDHSALAGRSPHECHFQSPPRLLAADFQLPKRLPLTVGCVHFMRRVSHNRTISLLNLTWDVPAAEPHHGVWGTLAFARRGATLRVFDAAPDTSRRTCLARFPFPVHEPILPLRPEFLPQEQHDVLMVDSVVKVLSLNTMS
jgi:transposase InsO family protein